METLFIVVHALQHKRQPSLGWREGKSIPIDRLKFPSQDSAANSTAEDEVKSNEPSPQPSPVTGSSDYNVIISSSTPSVCLHINRFS